MRLAISSVSLKLLTQKFNTVIYLRVSHTLLCVSKQAKLY